jgi:hypothetical protein
VPSLLAGIGEDLSSLYCRLAAQEEGWRMQEPSIEPDIDR